MQAISISFTRRRSAASSRSAILCPSNAKPPAGCIRTEGIQNQSQRGDADSASLATDRATLSSIGALLKALDAVAAEQPANPEAYATLWKQWRQEVASLSPQAMERANAADRAKLRRLEQIRHPSSHLAETFESLDEDAAGRRAWGGRR